MKEQTKYSLRFQRSLRPGHRVLILLVILVAILLVTNLDKDITTLITSTQAAVISISAAGGLIVAIEGLNTWHQQIRGKTDYELAIKLGKDAFHLRDLICAAGNMSLYDPSSDADGQTEKDDDSGAIVEVIESWKNPKFLRQIDAAIAALWEDRKEAELLWGEEVHEVVFPLEELGHELSNYAGYLQTKSSKDVGPRYAAMLDKVYKDKRNPIADSGPPNDNEFQQEVRTEARKVREYLSRFLDAA